MSAAKHVLSDAPALPPASQQVDQVRQVRSREASVPAGNAVAVAQAAQNVVAVAQTAEPTSNAASQDANPTPMPAEAPIPPASYAEAVASHPQQAHVPPAEPPQQLMQGTAPPELTHVYINFKVQRALGLTPSRERTLPYLPQTGNYRTLTGMFAYVARYHWADADAMMANEAMNVKMAHLHATECTVFRFGGQLPLCILTFPEVPPNMGSSPSKTTMKVTFVDLARKVVPFNGGKKDTVDNMSDYVIVQGTRGEVESWLEPGTALVRRFIGSKKGQLIQEAVGRLRAIAPTSTTVFENGAATTTPDSVPFMPLTRYTSYSSASAVLWASIRLKDECGSMYERLVTMRQIARMHHLRVVIDGKTIRALCPQGWTAEKKAAVLPMVKSVWVDAKVGPVRQPDAPAPMAALQAEARAQNAELAIAVNALVEADSTPDRDVRLVYGIDRRGQETLFDLIKRIGEQVGFKVLQELPRIGVAVVLVDPEKSAEYDDDELDLGETALVLSTQPPLLPPA